MISVLVQQIGLILPHLRRIFRHKVSAKNVASITDNFAKFSQDREEEASMVFYLVSRQLVI